MERTEKFSLELPEDVAELIKTGIESGDFDSASEVISEAVREMAEREAEREERLKEIIASLEKAEASPIRYTSEEVGEYLRRQHERLMAERDKTA